MCNHYSWTGEAWSSVLPIFGRIINLPFIKELSDGTLPVEKFRSYIAQDELYLGNYGRQILRSASLEGNPYREWIEEYGNEEFTEGVRSVLRLADQYALNSTESVRRRAF